jgi:hypothetical protein
MMTPPELQLDMATYPRARSGMDYIETQLISRCRKTDH